MFRVVVLLLLAAGSCVECEELTQPPSVTLQSGQSLRIDCGVSYSVASYYTSWVRHPAGKGLEWIGTASAGYSYYKDSLKNQFSINVNPSSNTVTLNGQNTQPGDTAVYYCARYYTKRGGPTYNYWYLDFWGKGTQVTVTSGTPAPPTVFPLMQCGSVAGDMVTLGCLATGFKPLPLTFAWSKDGADLSDFIQYPSVEKDNLYTGVSQIRVRQADWDSRAKFRCVAKHSTKTVDAVITKTEESFYKLPTLKVLASSHGQDEASIVCFAKDFSPNVYDFKWLHNEEDISHEIEQVITLSKARKTANGTTLYSAASLITLKSNEWSSGTTVRCKFTGRDAHGDVYINSSVSNMRAADSSSEGCPEADVDIQISGPTMEDIFLNKKGTVICQVKASRLSVQSILWEDQDDNEMAGTLKSTPENDSGPFETRLDITYDEWSTGIARTCVVKHSKIANPVKKSYKRTAGKSTQNPAVFMMPPVEQTDKNMVTLTCLVKDFFPQEVLVSWLVDDNPVNSTYVTRTTQPVENQGVYSVYGQLTLSLDQWKRNGVAYCCAIYHQSLANTPNVLVRSISYRTTDNVNMDDPKVCKAQ